MRRKASIIRLVTLAVFFVFMHFSCDLIGDRSRQDALDKAFAEVEYNPMHSLQILDSIPNPETMPEADYMWYTVVHTQAKYKSYHDITNDTLIFEAQRYFNNLSAINRTTRTALANFYAAATHYEEHRSAEALEAYTLAATHSEATGVPLFYARSQHNIGLMYNEQLMYEEALPYLRDAIKSFSQIPDTDYEQKLVLANLSITYLGLKHLDSAMTTLLHGMEIARATNDTMHISIFYQNIGLVHWKSGEYDLAKTNTHKALALNKKPINSLKLYTNLSLLHNMTNNPDSSQYYRDKVVADMQNTEEIDKETLAYLYSNFSDDYEKKGDYKSALHYSNLTYETIFEIDSANHSMKLMLVEERAKGLIREKEHEQDIERLIGLLVVVSSILVMFFSLNYNRVKNIRTKMLQQRLRNENLLIMNAKLTSDKRVVVESISNSDFLLAVYNSILFDGALLCRKVNLLASRQLIIDRSTGKLLSDGNALHQYLSKTVRKHFVDASTRFFINQTNNAEAVGSFSDDELIILHLIYFDHTPYQISTILGYYPSREQYDELIKKIHDLGMDHLTIVPPDN